MHAAFSNAFPPRRGRTHEATGPGAAAFAAILCGLRCRTGGTALWISEGWQVEGLHPAGLAPFCDPARLLLVRTADQSETLACAEEALRSGAVAVVVADLTAPLGLTPGRRLQLAAEAGAQSGGTTGLCLIPEGAGSNAAETRWSCAPIFGTASDTASDRGDSTRHRWSLIKNKSGTFAEWTVRWDAETHRVIVVSEPAGRAYPARAGAAAGGG